nr:vimentin-type intermediate filament-associated coiled-coil protein isoform X2 [Manis javanica]
MSAPPPLQIREANAHLAAVHRRAAELEAQLDAAERTVSTQAERLARHDQQMRAALDELGRAKDRQNRLVLTGAGPHRPPGVGIGSGGRFSSRGRDHISSFEEFLPQLSIERDATSAGVGGGAGAQVENNSERAGFIQSS